MKPKKNQMPPKEPAVNRLTGNGLCPIVAIGSSAGGLAALKSFFQHMPGNSGMAFVLVPHLDPSHKSLMVELLANQTDMSVEEIKDKQLIEANHVYIIPPGKFLEIKHAELCLLQPPISHNVDTAIDHFFRSLAADQMEQSIGIIMSGTSSHGCIGLQAIKASGGMVIVQSPGTAEYDSMPKNAIDRGIVDFILPAEEMPSALIKYVQHARESGAWSGQGFTDSDAELVDDVLTLLQVHTRYDFHYYRKNMINRRIKRRMSLNQINQLSEYCKLISSHPEEARLLYQDLLIGVTGFFRDVEAFDVLEQKVIPHWIETKDSDNAIRIWVPGCATGEEAYSIAILLLEKYSSAQKPLRLQIFATDIDETALDIARKGSYPVSIAADVSAERLARFFTHSGSHYQVNKRLRESVVFATQNLISDPPFSKLDLVSCRNLLIYLEQKLQQKIISLFHFGLQPGGFLLLGSSETVGLQQDLFETVSKKWCVFRSIGPAQKNVDDFPPPPAYERRSLQQSLAKPLANRKVDFTTLTQQQLLQDYAPAAVLINHNYEVLYFYGETGDFLQAPTGEPTRDLIALTRHGLQTKLRAACYRAMHENTPIIDNTARVKHNNGWKPCSIHVKPLVESQQDEVLLLVTFLNREPEESAALTSSSTAGGEESSIVQQLEYELKMTQNDLQMTIQDMNSSKEELKASNEELMSMNEELQSSNEELETSREELQSLNEELNTANNQLQEKIEELDKAHNDMSNLLKSSDIATLFLDTRLCIKSFTPATAKLLGLIRSDIGRPISKFATDFTTDELLADARQVLQQLTPLENTLKASNGRYYMRRSLPYYNSSNQVEGVVVTFFDITLRLKSEQQSRKMATILKDSNDAIILFDLDGSITAWNRGAETLYGYSEAEGLKLNIADIVPADKQAETRDLLQQVAAGGKVKSFDSLRLTKDGRIQEVWVTLTPLTDEAGHSCGLVTTERGMHERKQFDALKAQTDRLLSLVEHLPVAAVFVEKKNMLLNQAAEELTGYTREEIANIDIWFDRLYREYASKFRRQYQNARAAGFIESTGAQILWRKNGERRYVEYAAYRFEDYEIWILHDVTRAHEAKLAMREREARLRAIMDSAAEAIVVFNGEGIVSDFNNAAVKIFGYAPKEIIGHKVSRLLSSPFSESHDFYLEHYKQTGDMRIMNKPHELPGKRKDGSVFPLRLTVTEVGHLKVFIGIIHDLSEQKLLEKEIADISMQEREHIGQEIHDGLGQNLTGLSMIVETLKRKFVGRNLPEIDLLEELSTQIHQAIVDARNLTSDLVPVPYLPDGLKNALNILADKVSKIGGLICTFEAHDAVDISDHTVAMQIYRIIQEAVNNAVKHAQASKIHIDMNRIGNMVKFSVSDNGCGFQAENPSTSGLGIRIMNYRASSIGYTLEIESIPNAGTTLRGKPLYTG